MIRIGPSSKPKGKPEKSVEQPAITATAQIHTVSKDDKPNKLQVNSKNTTEGIELTSKSKKVRKNKSQKNPPRAKSNKDDSQPDQVSRAGQDIDIEEDAIAMGEELFELFDQELEAERCKKINALRKKVNTHVRVQAENITQVPIF